MPRARRSAESKRSRKLAGFPAFAAVREAPHGICPAGAQRRVGMQEEEPRCAAGGGTRRELSAAAGSSRHDHGAGAAGDRRRIVA